ncbi:putative protein S-acyltransferase 13 [Diplonema papillatum]|nr:putative protein S-acyltransferase 13 [Diplonema papillatum]KAJ9469735.1 putative protein S-acyltransferase 13 [Diplonema papillatum]KAJ9469736.1 putative protein S-acyltransferase 13 [Diplonema papillatum]
MMGAQSDDDPTPVKNGVANPMSHPPDIENPPAAPPPRVTTETPRVAEQIDEWRSSQPKLSQDWKAPRGLMIVVVVTLAMFTYVPYVVLNESKGAGRIVCSVVITILQFMMFWAYVQIVITDPGTVPPWWHEAVSTTAPSSYPMCRKSKLFKPPRSHFDSSTKRLVLNMDHYCPWVANTVGYFNRKYFMQFIFYTSLTCLWFTISSLIAFRDHIFDLFESGDDNTVSSHTRVLFGIGFFISATFGFLVSLMTTLHINYVLSNATSIEGSDKPQYNVGKMKNWTQVFGKEPLYWLIPIWGNGPVGDGIRWPTREGLVDGLV